jgi:thioredoxin reductase
MCACSGTSSLAPVIKRHIYFIAFMERYLTPSEKILAIGDVSCSSGRRHITAVSSISLYALLAYFKYRSTLNTSMKIN